MKTGKAVVALSGGLDSCVTAAIANEKYNLAFFHANYGQRTEQRELQAFHQIAEYYSVSEKLVADFKHFGVIGGSSLTDSRIQISRADLKNKNIPSSYVPFRNANILSACVSWAETLKAEAVFIGAVHEDSSGYPDCRPEFFDAFEKTVKLGTRPDTSIRIFTPVIHLSKSEIVKKGLEMNAPLQLTWSCYKNQDAACGVCDSCALRLKGFREAGIEDPITYIERLE